MFTIFILPAASRIFVDRIPISITVPRKSLIVTISPTLYSFSNIINIPAIISAMRGCAPRPTTRVKTPTDARSAVVSTPHAFKAKIIIVIAQAYFTKPSSSANIVFPRLFFSF